MQTEGIILEGNFLTLSMVVVFSVRDNAINRCILMETGGSIRWRDAAARVYASDNACFHSALLNRRSPSGRLPGTHCHPWRFQPTGSLVRLELVRASRNLPSVYWCAQSEKSGRQASSLSSRELTKSLIYSTRRLFLSLSRLGFIGRFHA